jgi:hypothetical protein
MGLGKVMDYRSMDKLCSNILDYSNFDSDFTPTTFNDNTRWYIGYCTFSRCKYSSLFCWCCIDIFVDIGSFDYRLATNGQKRFEPKQRMAVYLILSIKMIQLVSLIVKCYQKHLLQKTNRLRICRALFSSHYHYI